MATPTTEDKKLRNEVSGIKMDLSAMYANIDNLTRNLRSSKATNAYQVRQYLEELKSIIRKQDDKLANFMTKL
jgi:predicted  nucleic acid-binding Zn-ribbon protein